MQDALNGGKNDKVNFAGQEIDSLTSIAGYTQIIDKATHTINKW